MDERVAGLFSFFHFDPIWAVEVVIKVKNSGPFFKIVSNFGKVIIQLVVNMTTGSLLAQTAREAVMSTLRGRWFRFGAACVVGIENLWVKTFLTEAIKCVCLQDECGRGNSDAYF